MAFTIPEEIAKTFRPGEQAEIERLLLLMTTASMAEVEDFSIMGGGLTNRNYKVTLTNGKKIAMHLSFPVSASMQKFSSLISKPVLSSATLSMAAPLLRMISKTTAKYCVNLPN